LSVIVVVVVKLKSRIRVFLFSFQSVVEFELVLVGVFHRFNKRSQPKAQITRERERENIQEISTNQG